MSRREFGLQDLDDDLARVLEIFGQVDRRHTARTELTLDAVAVPKCFSDGQALNWRKWWSGCLPSIYSQLAMTRPSFAA